MARKHCLWCGKPLTNRRTDSRYCCHSHASMHFIHWRKIKQQMKAQIPVEEFLTQKAARESRQERMTNDGS